MSLLQIPVTATNMPEWIRRCATAVNGALSRLQRAENQLAEPYLGTSVTLEPVALPSSPAVGMTVFDTADRVVKTWDGFSWRAHY